MRRAPPMRGPTFLALAAAILVCAVPALGQTCELFAGSPSGCASFLNGTVIWLPPNTTQAEVADALNAQTDVSLLLSFASLAPTCINTAVSFLCRQGFPTCVPLTGSAGPTYLYSPICQDACLSVLSICEPVLANPQAAALGVKAPNCSAESAYFPPAPQYPNGNLSLTLGPDTFSLPCDANNIGTPALQCPKTRYQQLLPIPDGEPKDNSLNCFACPIYVYSSHDHLHMAWVGASVIGGLSVLACIITVVPILSTPSRRVYPGILIAYLCFTTAVGGLVMMFHGMVGYERTFCESETYTGGFSHPPCVVSGFFWYSSLLSSSCWITAIIFDIWWAIGLKRQRKPWFHWLYIGVCWGVPVTLGLILVAMRQFIYNNFAFCFIADYWPVGTTNELPHAWITMTVWYIPQGSMLIWNTGALGYVLYCCFKSSKNFKGAMNLARNQWRTFAYFLFYFYTLGLVLGNWFHLEKNRAPFRKGTTDFFTCVFTSTSPEACEPHLPPPGWIVQTTLYWSGTALGIWAFLVFGVGGEQWQFWKRVGQRAANFTLSASTTSAERTSVAPTPVTSFEGAETSRL